MTGKTKKSAKKIPKGKQDPKDAKIADLTETLQRLQADFENYKKQLERSNAAFQEQIRASFIEKLLPVIDHFELALKNIGQHQEFVKGIELIYAQLFGILEAEGVRPIESVGKKCDPYRHEVMLQAPATQDKDGIVLEEMQKGYMMHDKVLRLAKVKIGQFQNTVSNKNEKKGDADKGRMDKQMDAEKENP
jgi:molecular chaperone GrpE